MNTLSQGLSIVTSVSFLYYGTACLTSSAMKAEFERFGVAKLRIVIGVLELMGSLGLLVGFLVPVIGVLAAAGISLLMSSVVVQRIQQRDTLAQMAQAAVFALIATWLTVCGYLNL